MRTIIIDDEAQSHRALKELLLKNHAEVQLLANGMNVQEGYELIRKHRPEVVFLDIEMPDGLGFDLLEKMDNHDFHVIFITAHNKYALTAIKFGALDYLLKPIAENELAKAIEKAKLRLRPSISQDQIQIILDTYRNLEMQKLPSRIAISTTEGILYQPVEKIIRLEAQQNYTSFFLLDQPKPILASVNIGEYEGQFELYIEYMKVHRSHIINLNFVEKFVKADGGYLVMKDRSQVSVSRANRELLIERLGRL